MYKKITKPILFCVFLSLSFFACEKPPVEPNEPIDPTVPTEIEYTLSHTSLDFGVAGGQAEFTLTVKYPAIIESIKVLDTDTWCRVSTTGDSSITVIVTVDSNTNYEVRNTSVVINMKLRRYTASATVLITQEEVKIPEWILIDGIKWATRNVDMPGTFAAKPEDPGMFYQWNRKIGWSVTDPMINSEGGTTWDSSFSAGNTWEKANDPCPTGWRLPDLYEQLGLSYSSRFWGELNGIPGSFFGSGDQRVFFPAVGYRDRSDGLLSLMGNRGNYWSSTIYNSEGAYMLDVSSVYTGIGAKYRSDGYSLRCVAEQ